MKILVTVYNATPYFERFVLTALCEVGYIHDAYHCMMSRYYNLATNENFTLWEDFYILGLKTEDGFKSSRIAPVAGIFKDMHCEFRVNGEIVEKHIDE